MSYVCVARADAAVEAAVRVQLTMPDLTGFRDCGAKGKCLEDACF